jgi:hypothetical protein
VGAGCAVVRGPLGWGLQTGAQAVPAGATVTQYHGRLLTAAEVAGLASTSHVCATAGLRQYIDGLRQPVPGLGGGSFANHHDQPNARLVRRERGVFVVALVDLAPHTDVTVDYRSALSMAW